jgi:hypothetical protein
VAQGLIVTARLACWLALLGVACASVEAPDGGAGGGYPGELVPSDRIPGNFLLRQRVDYRYGDAQGSFEAVVQKYCGELTVVGFAPFGGRAFSIRQQGLEVEVDSRWQASGPFPPRYVLVDIHRSLFVPIPADPPRDGTRELPHGEETIEESWSSGRLTQRSFRRNSGQPAGRVVVTYVGGVTPDSPPGRIRLHNGWYDYDLDVSVVTREELECPAETARRVGASHPGAPGPGI